MMDLLNQVGEFLTTYGGWGAAIFFGYYDLRQDRLNHKDRDAAAALAKEEREKIGERFQEYYDKLVDLSVRSTGSNKLVAAELRAVCKILGRKDEDVNKAITDFVAPRDNTGDGG